MAYNTEHLLRVGDAKTIYDHVNGEVTDLESDVTEVKDLLGFEEDTYKTIYKSLANNATDGAIISLAPYIIHKLSYSDAPYIVKAIKIKIKNTLGTLTVGRVLKTKAEIGITYNSDDFTDSQTIQVNQSGEQILSFEPIEITNDYYFFVGLKTDTAIFSYGGSGTGLTGGFLYQSGSSFVLGNSNLGIDLLEFESGAPSNIRNALNSTYKTKKLSILGDSVSTFSGYIPEGNETYYPSGTVTSVSDTWWYKLYTALGMVLDTNNSWSGSRVTTTAGETSAGCMTRCQSLGTNPDVIIVWMGINDFNNEVALGTYDGTTSLPEVTTTFREAYAIMLNKILTSYPCAEVWVCTLPQCERNGESGFPEVNGNGVALLDFNKAILELADAFGVKVLDHNKCGLTYQNMPTYNPDNLHPNKYGHSLIANNDIWQMDGAINVRYPIS